MKAIFFGECMLEYFEGKSQAHISKQHFGGDTLNTAIYFSRLINQGDNTVFYATGIGDDEESRVLMNAWQSEGINTELVKVIAGKTLGRYYITIDDKGERLFSYQRDDSAAKHYFHGVSSHEQLPSINALADALTSGKIDYFYFSGITLAIFMSKECEQLFEMLAEFKHDGGQVIFDNNYRPLLWQSRDPRALYDKAMKLADIAFLTDEDEYSLYGGDSVSSIIERYQPLKNFNLLELVIKQGRKPCIIKPGNQQGTCQGIDPQALIYVASNTIAPESIVDTTAAGDSFAAGYLAERIKGGAIKSAAKRAHQLAGQVIQHHGAIIGLDEMPDDR
ncbi:sugar kinase [Colwelliaceae bacterium 6441]